VTVAYQAQEGRQMMTEHRAFEVGAWLTPQHTTTGRLREAWTSADALGVDSLWIWDHFFPLTGDPEGTHLEGWSLLAAMAVETTSARIGPLVTNYEYRNPDLLADMARTVDHLSGGRLVLGLGAGWVERDYTEYGYPFRNPGTRIRELGDAIVRIRGRLAKLNPAPLGSIPLLIGGDGEKVMLGVVAAHADQWNTMAWRFVSASHALDDWCERLGRDPKSIKRSCFITDPAQLDALDELLDAGADEIIVQLNDPFPLEPVAELLRLAKSKSPARIRV
jgi:probable F420-dependent oxidoreductase